LRVETFDAAIVLGVDSLVKEGFDDDDFVTGFHVSHDDAQDSLIGACCDEHLCLPIEITIEQGSVGSREGLPQSLSALWRF
jgi:hypothetical protein